MKKNKLDAKTGAKTELCKTAKKLAYTSPEKSAALHIQPKKQNVTLSHTQRTLHGSALMILTSLAW